MTSTPPAPTFAERVVARATTLVPGVSRRGFLYRAAVVGSALAVNPFDFLLKPGTAYAQVCGDAASCSNGWSAFCCTINDGANTCPPGSYVAGWWKVDDSSFCRGAARYYIDCNREPGASCACKCADGPCDKRRTCCNVFRYGQCNQQVSGVTEVVCRVVTCQAPWEWDPSCTTTVRTDNRTRTHTASCLPGQWPSHVAIKYQDLGLSGSALGRPVEAESGAARNGRKRRYAGGIITWQRSVGAHAVYGVLADRYDALSGPRGALGFAVADQEQVGDGRGVRARFERGTIWRTPATGTWEVLGAVLGRYRQLDGPRGPLGYPVSAYTALAGGHVSEFEHGAIYAAAGRRGIEVTDPILRRYQALGGPAGRTSLGFPAGRPGDANGGGRKQRFDGGVILTHADTGVWGLWGEIARRYRELGEEASPLGYPTSNQSGVGDGRGEHAPFQGGRIWSTRWTGAHLVTGPILDRYLDEGGPTGALGYPTTDAFTPDPPAGRRGNRASPPRRCAFEHGVITHAASGETAVVRGRPTRDAGAVPAGTPTTPRPPRG